MAKPKCIPVIVFLTLTCSISSSCPSPSDICLSLPPGGGGLKILLLLLVVGASGDVTLGLFGAIGLNLLGVLLLGDVKISLALAVITAAACFAGDRCVAPMVTKDVPPLGAKGRCF